MNGSATSAAVAPAVVHTMPAAQFRFAQRRHFVLSVLLPTALALAAPLVLPVSLSPWHSPGLASALWLGMWFVVGGVGVSVGLHRHFSHRSFDAAPGLRALLGVCGSMAAQGPVIYWVALHRMHHAASDRPGDPHSPRASAWPGPSGQGRWRAALQGHAGWVLDHDVPKPTRYARELIGDPLVRRLAKAYPLCVAAGVVLPALVAWAAMGGWAGLLFGAYWGGVVRIALGHHVIWAINSWCHLRGTRAHDTADSSANVAWLSLVSWGESWHNNHHARPTQARFGDGIAQPDIGWWVVRAFVALGWARLRPEAGGEQAPTSP
jgi:stearoyl-CoA desaturase (Delta-9 desaturase)